MGKIDVSVPDIGDFKDVPVIEVLVKPGDEVKVDQSLVTLESDKATMDVPSPIAGKVAEVVAKVGDKVSMGTLLARVETAEAAAEAPAPARAPVEAPPAGKDGSAAQPPAKAPPEAYEPRAMKDEPSSPPPHTLAPASPPAAPSAGGPAKPDFTGVFAGPAVRRLARELDLDLNAIKGTGEHGRITREDVKAALAGAAPAAAPGGGALPAIPPVDFEKFGPVETVPLSRIKRISGPRLHASWVNVPHVTHTDEADITELEAFRKRLDEEAKKDKSPYRVSLLPLLMRAAVATLKAFPTFNAALSPDGGSLILRKYWHIGVAVDTPDGLVVAVIKDVDRKGVLDLARELGELSEKARAGKLAPPEMQGATFTISSLGGIGGVAFTPIVNAPEVAILGVVRSKMAPVWDGEAFRPRLMLPLCLSYDHRVIDGAAAARFMRRLAGIVEDMRRVIL